MEVRHLQTFVRAAELESFTHAGEQLRLTQPAVSQQIAALEKQLQVALFDRTGRAVTLTDAGRRLYDYARRILDLIEEAGRAVGQFCPTICGELSIASSTVPAETVLPHLLADFRALYPDVRESVVVSDSSDVAAAVQQGHAELGFVGELPRSLKLTSQLIGDDALVLIVAPSHPLAGKKKVSLRQLSAEPLIVREPGSGTRRCVEQVLEAAGVSPGKLNIVMEINSNEAIRAAVSRGLGGAFQSRRAVEADIASGRFVPVTVTGLRPVRQLYLVTDPKRLPSAAMRAFLALVERWTAAQN